MREEPVAIAAAIVALVECVVVWAIARNWLGDADAVMILGVIAIAAPLVGGFFARRLVTPVKKVK